MENVIILEEYKQQKQQAQAQYYLENYELALDLMNNTYAKPKPSKEEADRAMQLAYMKLYTKRIENNT